MIRDESKIKNFFVLCVKLTLRTVKFKKSKTEIMRIRLLLAAFACLLFIGAQGQSIGLIGSATPGGWDVDTNMVQDMDSAHLWTLSITLTEGAAKFRQDDAWDVNWGASDFPMGVGEQGGPDIPVYAGEYNISFNSNTGEYFFDVVSPIGIIGSATPGGWDADSKMYQDSTPSTFFTTLDLVVGEAKFRQDADWIINWGSPDFPMGIGVQDGDNIQVDKAGEYRITLDTMTGAYNFEEVITFETIGIIGDATPGGWDEDTDLTQSGADPNLWMTNIELTEGAVKFRANDAWDLNWGGGMFPMDTATVGGDDIVAMAGLYQVSFNTETLVYEFLPVVYYESIGIIGDATPGGWDADTDMARVEGDSAQWELRIELADGEAKFRANDEWVVDWGAGDFPTGTGTQGGANIPITAGEYIISFNTTTGDYNFEEIVVFDTVGIIGTGTINGDWDNDVYMDKSPDDEQLWTLTTDLMEGEMKFRAESDWAVNWGPEDNTDAFPSGVGVQDGQNILTVAGTYMISLRTDDGTYGFQEPSSAIDIPVVNAIKVFPNPASTVINIEMDAALISGLIKVDVIDINGKLISSNTRQAQSNMKLDVSQLTAGQYFVKMYNDEFLLAKPISILR